MFDEPQTVWEHSVRVRYAALLYGSNGVVYPGAVARASIADLDVTILGKDLTTCVPNMT